MKLRWILIAGAAAVVGGLLIYFGWFRHRDQFRNDPALQASLNNVLADYRRIIVLMDGQESLDDQTRNRCLLAGRKLFHDKQEALDQIAERLTSEYSRKNTDGIRQLTRYLSDDHSLHDADKLAFLDVIDELNSLMPRDSREPIASSIRGAFDNLQSIQLAYREEVTRIFSQFETRGVTGSREKWDSYVRFLKTQNSREKVLAESGGNVAAEPENSMRGANRNEVFGNDFPEKSVALTFDDGPHRKYTEQILALLRKYGMRACFFELGKNLGRVGDSNQVQLGPTAEVARKVLEAGHVIANHSYSHPELPKLSEPERVQEIERTNLILTKVIGQKPMLFRPPYGARNQAILDEVNADGLKPVMWNIDSLDWADPIPESIAMRVLHELNRAHRGIILFHDIHRQSVAALPQVIEELIRQDYTFLSFEQGRFVKSPAPLGGERAVTQVPLQPIGAPAAHSLYRESWAIIIGINDYQQWPKLRYCVNDANAIERVLISKFGFKKENIRKLIDGEATRQRILAILGDEFANANQVQREDRVFFFFAGHGATRTLADNREIGFIIPVDADPSNYYSTAISMNSLRDACDLIAARHIYFVMDSCYSGLALTRGAGAFSQDHSYLEEITRRVSRQILTAGGAEQQVADDGPDGHSVFTWALLQGLTGQADLDNNGFITASELGAYVSPIVSKFSRQTPAVGNLVGSEGGEFVFELQPEPLSSASQQFDPKAMQLTGQLETLQKEIAAKQAELLKLQESVQAESAKLAKLDTSRGAPAPKLPSSRAYELDRRGQQFYREKKYDQALQAFQQAVQLKPNDPVLLNNLGFIYYKLDRYDDALAWLQKTLEADPKRKEAHGNIAELYLKMGRRTEAKEHYEQYLALWPNSPKAAEVREILKTLN